VKSHLQKDEYPPPPKAELKLIAERINAANRKERAENEKKRKEAYKEAVRLTAQFAEIDKELKKVILFGSTLGPGRYGSESDIDLAVEGGDFFGFMRIAEESSFKVDVVDLQDLPERFKTLIDRSSEILFNRGKGQ
jgi:predicted nucleotidyltransferase